MKKLIEKLAGTALWVLGGSFMVATFYGPYHAFTKHGNGMGFASAFVPPVGWYMAAEGLFWHDDFSGVDWDVRKKNDVKTIGVLLTVASSEIDETKIDEFGQAVEAFAGKIHEYPKEQMQYLKMFGRTYVSYSDSLMDDTRESFRDALFADGRVEFSISEKTRLLEKEVLGFQGAEELVENFKESMSALNMMVEAKGQMGPLPADKAELLLHALDVKWAAAKRKTRSTYTDIFGESI